MKLIKDKYVNDLSQSEISCISFEPRKKFLASASYHEAVLLQRYPIMKLFKKIIHREKLPLDPNQDISEIDEKLLKTSASGEQYSKGEIISATHLLFNSAGSQLIIAYINGDISIYDTRLWKKIGDLQVEGQITSMSLTQKGTTLFIGTLDSNLYLISTKTWKVRKQSLLDSANNGRMIITEDLKTLYMVADKKRVRAVDFKTLEEQMVFKGHKSGINMIRLSPDESVLATCGNDGKMCLFDTNTGELLSLLLGHTDEVHACIFSIKGDYIVSSSEDMSVRLWDAATFKCVKIIQGIPNAFAMERYENIIIMGNVDGGLQSFKIF